MTPRYEGKSRTKFHVVVGIFLFVAFLLSAGLFLHAGILRGMVLSKAFKHALTTSSALVGVVLTVGQAIKSFQKSNDHKGAPSGNGDVETNAYNSEHLWRVGILWIIGAIAASLTVLGELVDFYNDGLEW
jgi:hypothetical protein